MTGIVVSLLLAPAMPTAPVPPVITAKPVANGVVNRNEAQNFAQSVYRLADQVAAIYVLEKKDHVRELMSAAARGLYEEVGQAVPDAVAATIANANSVPDMVQALADARILLGDNPKLSGAKSMFAAVNGFKYATDPGCGLYSARLNTFASVDQDFGVGIELEGVVGTRWALYQLENMVASGRMGRLPGWFGPNPRVDQVVSPAGLPWKVRRVIPGSPAQRAGVKPGDIITHFNGNEITAENANSLFAEFASPRAQMIDPNTGQIIPPDRSLTIRRDKTKPFTASLKAEAYTPESAFGVMRTQDDKWDCMLDRKHKIGYIRLGPIETGLDVKVGEMMTELMSRGCRALVLDLRWCPGGYVTPGTAIAGMFLPGGTVISRMEYRDPAQAGTSGEIRTPLGGGKYADLPLVVLVGQETTGGGELIASALKDNNRCVVIGQRTVGRASIQNARDAGFGGVQFRVTTGTSFRPNGKARQRKPDSQPTDEWGIRPDPGLEVPVTADLSAQLRRQAELHSLRPADSRDALPFDDVNDDPYRLAALAYLRKKLDPLPESK